MRYARRLVLVLALAGLAAPGALAQETSAAPAPAAAASGQVPAAGPSEPTASTRLRTVEAGGLPERAAPPRTLRDHWHVFVAFALAWLLLFGYTVSLARRFARVERELLSRG